MQSPGPLLRQDDQARDLRVGQPALGCSEREALLLFQHSLAVLEFSQRLGLLGLYLLLGSVRHVWLRGLLKCKLQSEGMHFHRPHSTAHGLPYRLSYQLPNQIPDQLPYHFPHCDTYVLSHHISHTPAHKAPLQRWHSWL